MCVAEVCFILHVSINIYNFNNSILFDGKLPLLNMRAQGNWKKETRIFIQFSILNIVIKSLFSYSLNEMVVEKI